MISVGSECHGLKGKYSVTKEIAEGGMGRVYEARSVSGDEVVIKVPQTKVGGQPMDPTLYILIVKKLKVEAHVLKNFSTSRSSFIVKYIDESKDPNNFFLVTEKIHGKTMSKTIPATGMPEQQLITMSLSILRGLEFIHKHNTVYRDMKPDNIMVQNNGHCVMIDFGAVKQGTTLAPDRTVIGNPGWSCPHQKFENKSSAECDLYTFGKVMFYMGTRIKPAQLTNSLGRMTKKMRDIKPNISIGLSELVDRMVDPEHNTIHTAREVITELEQLQQTNSQQQPKRLHSYQQHSPQPQQQYKPQPSAPHYSRHKSYEPKIVLQGVEYRISNKSGGSLIGKKHDEQECQRMGGGCNDYNHGRNIFVGWKGCPSRCHCRYNPAHWIDKHHMRVWKDRHGNICVVNNDPYRRSAINRHGKWILMTCHKKEVLKNHDQVALLYNEEEGPYMEFTFYER